MEIGKNILNLRKKKGLSQEELGEKIGVTRQTISNWELGITNPNPDQLKEISKEFNISIDELLDNDIRDVLVEKVSNIKKQSNTILMLVKILLLMLVVGLIIFGILILVHIINKRDTGRRIDESIYCKIYGEEHGYNIIYEELTGIPLEMGGDSYFSDILELSKYNDAHQIFNVINDYVKKNGGSCYRVLEHNLDELVSVSIKEGSLTNNSVTLVIREEEDYDINYGEEFWLEKYNPSSYEYERIPENLSNNCGFNDMAYYASPSSPLELKQDWSCMYGSLSKGKYLLVKEVSFDSDNPINSRDIFHISMEFEIN